MKVLKVNGVLFKGQYADGVEKLMKHKELTVNDFNNGSWEATTQLKRFIELVESANMNAIIEGECLRRATVKLPRKVYPMRTKEFNTYKVF